MENSFKFLKSLTSLNYVPPGPYISNIRAREVGSEVLEILEIKNAGPSKDFKDFQDFIDFNDFKAFTSSLPALILKLIFKKLNYINLILLN